MSKISDLEKEVMQQIQKNVTIKNKVSLNALAEECHVSKSTIVKLAKKLGYSGYVEMVHKMYNEQEWTDPFRTDLIEGDLEWTVRKLAQKLREFSGCKNIIAKSPHGDYVCGYYSRKLQMFDIFATDTYDYGMVMNSRQKKGFALFCTQSYTYSDYVELMRLAQKSGYYISLSLALTPLSSWYGTRTSMLFSKRAPTKRQTFIMPSWWSCWRWSSVSIPGS